MPGGEPRHAERGTWRFAPEVVVVLVLALAFGSFQYDVAHRLGWASDPGDPSEIEPPAGLTLPSLAAPSAVAAPLSTSSADPAKVRAALAPYLRDRDLGRHVLAAVATADGKPLFDNGVRAVTPASTMKLLTAAAALTSLGPDHTFTTSVVLSSPHEIVLVGGGDPFLGRTPPRRDDYPWSADLRTLAVDAAAALTSTGVTRVRVGFDDSLFRGPAQSPAWPVSYDTDGVVAPISALWVDQGARNPGWGFEDDPARAAADVFVRELARAGLKVSGRPERTTADDTATPIASVDSPPVWQIVDRVLLVSDNEGAEVLAHHVGIGEGFGGSFAGAREGIAAALGRVGVRLSAADVVHDGSGLSRADRLTAATLLDVLTLGASDDHPALRTLVSALPVAGFNGSLSTRFEDGPTAGRGRVRAKTGTLTGVHGLAGVATDLDGNVLTFVLIADKVKVENTLDARQTLDRMAAALGACHCG